MAGVTLSFAVGAVPGELVALFAALLSSVGYVCAQQGLSDATPEALVTVTAAVSAAILVPIAVATGQTRLTPAMLGVFFVSGLVGTGLGRFILSNAITLVGSGTAHTVKSASPVVAVVFSVALLGETLTPLLAVGVLTVVVGLVVLTRTGKKTNSSVDARTTALVALLVIVWFGTTPVIRKFGLSGLNAPLVPALALNFTVALAVGIAMSLWHNETHLDTVLWGDGRWYLLATGLCWTASISSYFLALSLADAVVVVPIFNSSPLFTVTLGLLLFKGTKSPTRSTIVGAAVTVCGVVAITVA